MSAKYLNLGGVDSTPYKIMELRQTHLKLKSVYCHYRGLTNIAYVPISKIKTFKGDVTIHTNREYTKIVGGDREEIFPSVEFVREKDVVNVTAYITETELLSD